jgi:hypothetical protein
MGLGDYHEAEAKILEPEERLLTVYPESANFIEAVKRHGGLRESYISDVPYGELAAYGDQSLDEGPFWTLLRDDSTPYNFYVISFGLNPGRRSICARRRNGMIGGGKTFRGDAEINDILSPDKLPKLYEAWFVSERKPNK